MNASPNTRRATLKRAALLLFLLACAWLLWSGLYNPLLLGLGVFSCLLTVWVTQRMGYFGNEVFALQFGIGLLGYWAWLGKEIFRSSMDVARIVLDPRLPISPQVLKIKVSPNHPVEQAILGNSITLTPGSLTLDVHGGVITIHSLTKDGADDVLSGRIDRRVAALRKT